MKLAETNMSCSFEAVGVLIVLYLGYKLLDYLIRLPSIGRYNERYIFITGCDSGFGNEAAKKLDKMGCHVFAGCLTDKGASELKSACSNRLRTVKLNVTDSSSVRKARDFVKSNLPEGKGLWGMLNNAGIGGQAGPLEWLTIDDYKSCMEVNAWGVIDCAVTFLPLIKKEGGRVVNTASIMGRICQPNNVPYTVSKHAVEVFSDCLRRECHNFGVKVSIIEPGHFKTAICDEEGFQKNVTQAYNRTSKDIKAYYGEEFYKGAQEELSVLLFGYGTTDISPVVDAYIHALTSICPRPRYVVGNDAKFLYLGIQALPEWLGDWVIRFLQRSLPKPAGCMTK